MDRRAPDQAGADAAKAQGPPAGRARPVAGEGKATPMPSADDKLSGIISDAGTTLEQYLLKAYRIGFFDGHLDGVGYQRQEFASLVAASFSEMRDGAPAPALPRPDARLLLLNPEHPVLHGLREGLQAPVRIWVEVAPEI